MAHTPHNLELRSGPRRVAIPAFARSISARISTLAQKSRSGALAGNSEAFRDLFLRFGRILPARAASENNCPHIPYVIHNPQISQAWIISCPSHHARARELQRFFKAHALRQIIRKIAASAETRYKNVPVRRKLPRKMCMSQKTYNKYYIPSQFELLEFFDKFNF